MSPTEDLLSIAVKVSDALKRLNVSFALGGAQTLSTEGEAELNGWIEKYCSG